MAETAPTRAKLNHNLLLFYSTIAASVALSLVSGYETYLGLLDFMTDGIVGHIASAVLTFGIQVLLFVISWNIANHLRDGFRANIPRWAIWALCGFFSAYFSYYGFLYTTGGRNEDIRQQAIKSERSEILGAVNDNFKARLASDHQTKLLDAAPYKDWVDGSLRNLIQIAANSTDKIAGAARVAREALLIEQTAARNRLVPLEQQLGAAKVQLEISRRDLVRVQDEYTTRSQQIAADKSSRSTAAAEVARLEASLQQESATGTGPRTRAIELDLNSAKAALQGIDATLLQSEATFADLEKRKLELELNAENDVAAKQANDVAQQVELLKADIAEIEVRLASETEGIQFNFDEQQKMLETHLSNVASADYTAVAALTAQCSEVKQRLSGTVLRDEVAGIECTSSAVVEVVTSLTALQAAQKSFAETCLDPANHLPFERVEGKAGTLVNAAIDQISECASREADPELKGDLLVQVDTLKQQRGDNVDPITLASVALFVDRQGNAVMSAVFAIIVDVLVLLCALVGKNVGLPERVRAIDMMISRSRPIQGGSAGYEKQLDLAALDPQQRALIELVVPEMLRRDLMDYADESGDVLMLKRGAVARLSALRNQEIGDLGDGMLAAASGPPANPSLPRRRGLRN